MRRLWVLLCTSFLFAACSEPPQKEIDRAQGALDAARAAGAEHYATEPFNAATTALQQSREAVDQRDYRLALSRALDASERAQEAAKQSADGKAHARSASEQAINATSVALQQLDGRLKAAAGHVPANELAPATRAARDAAAALQKVVARTSVETVVPGNAAGRYGIAVKNIVAGLAEQLVISPHPKNDVVTGAAEQNIGAAERPVYRVRGAQQ